ncbi:MAG TPA: dihydrodipicolinate synthase family protein, partial [Stellaceae bacterium]|nr:dihydrodipicolinate synthase family protein [Stellaceae bacterium]
MTDLALQGIVAAPMLPMRSDFSVDWENTASYIAGIARTGPTAIAMNMDASEGPSLSREEQLEVVRVCRKAIGERCPLVSGLIAGSTADAVSFGRELRAAGA